MLKLVVKPISISWPFLQNNLQKPLTSKELVDISKEISDQYAPSLPISFANEEIDFKLSKQELREISQNISMYYAPRHQTNSQNLVLLPVDPERIYVYWNLGDNKSSHPFHEMFEQQLTLQIYSHTEDNQKKLKIYETKIKDVQSSQQIKLAIDDNHHHFSAKIKQYLPQQGYFGSVKSNLINSSYGKQHQTEQDNQSHNKFDVALNSTDVAANTKADKVHFAGLNHSGQRK